MKRIAVLTSGGDAPGMNAAIRAIVRFALFNKIEVFGVEAGYDGLIDNKIFQMNHRSVSNIIGRGGTILKTARSPRFLTASGQAKAVKTLKERGIDGLIVIGGNGSYRGAHILSEKWGIRCIGAPGTIDNDLAGTDFTIGFNTAVNTALDAIDKIRDTATSMERIYVVEVMGRTSGHIALLAALSGGAEDVLLPGRIVNINNICDDVKKGHRAGKVSWIIVVAEGAAGAVDVAAKIMKKTRFDARPVVLGHIQRGGVPSAIDRILGTRLGVSAVEFLMAGDTDKAVGIISGKITAVDLLYACGEKKGEFEGLYNLIKILR